MLLTSNMRIFYALISWKKQNSPLNLNFLIAKYYLFMSSSRVHDVAFDFVSVRHHSIFQVSFFEVYIFTFWISSFFFYFTLMYIICTCNPVSICLPSIYFPIAPPLWILNSHICWPMQHELILGKNGGVLCKLIYAQGCDILVRSWW